MKLKNFLQISLFFLFSSLLTAAEITKNELTEFKKDDLLSSSTMNANFEKLRIAVNDNFTDQNALKSIVDSHIGNNGNESASVYDFSKFKLTNAQIVDKQSVRFLVNKTAGGNACVREERTTSTNDVDGVVTQLRECYAAIDATVVLDKTTLRYKDINGARLLLSRKIEVASVGAPNSFNTTSDITFTTPFVVQPAIWNRAYSWGGGSEFRDSVSEVPEGLATEMSTILGLEDISVDGYAQTGCLKVHVQRNATSRLGSFSRINWYCPGLGLSKQMTVGTGGSTMTVKTLNLAYYIGV